VPEDVLKAGGAAGSRGTAAKKVAGFLAALLSNRKQNEFQRRMQSGRPGLAKARRAPRRRRWKAAFNAAKVKSERRSTHCRGPLNSSPAPLTSPAPITTSQDGGRLHAQDGAPIHYGPEHGMAVAAMNGCSARRLRAEKARPSGLHRLVPAARCAGGTYGRRRGYVMTHDPIGLGETA
jgi:hypothetical protein